MTGNLLQQIRKDARRYATSSGWEEDIQLSTPDQSLSVPLKGWHTKHKINQDTDGGIVASTNVHILLAEDDLIAVSYPYRNSRNQVIELKEHKVAAKNNAGQIIDYVIKESHPSESLGLIVCILSEMDNTPAPPPVEAKIGVRVERKINLSKDF